jgi:hypothetical protein
MSRKFKMQAAGNGANTKKQGANSKPYGDDQSTTTGQSGGGAYPNHHSKTKAKNKTGSFMGHGGQSEIRYYGGADKEASGGNTNGVTQDTE